MCKILVFLLAATLALTMESGPPDSYGLSTLIKPAQLPAWIGIPECLPPDKGLSPVKYNDCEQNVRLFRNYKYRDKVRFCTEKLRKPGGLPELELPRFLAWGTCELGIQFVDGETHEDVLDIENLWKKMELLLLECVVSKYAYGKRYGGSVLVGYNGKMLITFKSTNVHRMYPLISKRRHMLSLSYSPQKTSWQTQDKHQDHPQD
jgi:hypothetical protein